MSTMSSPGRSSLLGGLPGEDDGDDDGDGNGEVPIPAHTNLN